MVGVIVHKFRVPRLIAGNPGGQPLQVGGIDALVSCHVHAAHKGGRAGIDADVGIDLFFFWIKGVAGLGHGSQGVTLSAQLFRQGLHRVQQGVCHNRFAHGNARQHRGKGRWGNRLGLQSPKAYLALAVFKGSRHVRRWFVDYVGPAKGIARPCHKGQRDAQGPGFFIKAERGRTFIVTLGMQKANGRVHIGAGAAFQGKRTVGRFIGKLRQLAYGFHLAFKGGRAILYLDAQGVRHRLTAPGGFKGFLLLRLPGHGIVGFGLQKAATAKAQRQKQQQQAAQCPGPRIRLRQGKEHGAFRAEEIQGLFAGCSTHGGNIRRMCGLSKKHSHNACPYYQQNHMAAVCTFSIAWQSAKPLLLLVACPAFAGTRSRVPFRRQLMESMYELRSLPAY